MRFVVRIAGCALLTAGVLGQSPTAKPAPDAIAVRRYLDAHQQELTTRFSALLAIPNLAADTPNIERNAAAIEALYQAAGVHTELLRLPGAPPVVYGTLDAPGPGPRPTITFYAHYDGQPTRAADWRIPPFQPAVHDGRIWARSAGDDKAAVFGFAAALEALRASHMAPSVNLRFFLEGEEEAGSPHLAAYLRTYANQLHTDAWILCDGPVHQSGRMQVFFGARGVTDMDITVYGPNRALHDGHYGNWAPNPIAMLTRLLAGMRDDNARILIPGFYQDVRPLSAADRAAIAALPPYDATLAGILGLGHTENAPATLAEQIAQPALNIRGFQGGFVGSAAANAIPTQAEASLDFRLVPDQTPEHVQAEVEDYMRRQGYFLVRTPPDDATRRAHPKVALVVWGAGYPPARVRLDSPISYLVTSLVERALGNRIVQLPIMGGSIPMYLFQGGENTPVIGVPIANFDDNQHAANENLRLDYLWNGIVVYASLFHNLGGQ
ncbi:MAG TPA: M20/M25/M40 family metallo-hydrolase [Terriglobales bacterium]|nr:M20/M25/M40 family metallo-hydrolase [Terriglobales bacterium]